MPYNTDTLVGFPNSAAQWHCLHVKCHAQNPSAWNRPRAASRSPVHRTGPRYRVDRRGTGDAGRCHRLRGYDGHVRSAAIAALGIIAHVDLQNYGPVTCTETPAGSLPIARTEPPAGTPLRADGVKVTLFVDSGAGAPCAAPPAPRARRRLTGEHDGQPAQHQLAESEPAQPEPLQAHSVVLKGPNTLDGW